MSVKYPTKPDRIHRKITIDDRKLIRTLLDQYHNIRKELFAEKKHLRIEKLMPFSPDLANIRKKLKIIKQKNKENEHDILFLDNYPIIAIRHNMGLSWGTTSPR